MFRHGNTLAGAGLVLLLGAVSCSIKEDRSTCPCYLNLNVDQVVHDPDYANGLVTVMTSDALLEQNRIRLSDYEKTGYDTEVPRRTIHAMAAVGHDDLWWKNDTLYVATNLEWGPVMLARETLVCDDDDKQLAMKFHKEYCRMNFILVGVADVEKYPFDIRLRANANGVRMRDGKPVRGHYTVFASPSNTAMCSALVPRQEDYEMVVDLLWHSDGHEYTVEDYVTTLDVGKELQRNGYNWDKDDLDDVYVTIDIVKTTASINVKPWDSDQIEEII